jgi:hypothetical protein
MKLIRIFLIALIASFIGCNTPASDTLIAKNQLGLITPNTNVLDLNSILSQDSIAEFDIDSKFNRTREIEVFNNDGRISLVIEPNYKTDSIVTINEIQILDPRYKTKKGLNVESDYQTIYKNYKINNIQNSINSVILSIDEIGAYIVIDKKHLPSEIRFDPDLKIEANQIPDDAPLRYFWLRFDDTSSKS